MKSKAVVITDVRIEQRSGTDILVVEDGNENQFTTPNPYLVNRFGDLSEEQEDRYIGELWNIAFTVTKDGYRDFEGFLSKSISEDSDSGSVEDRVSQLEEVVAGLENQVRQLNKRIDE